MLLFECTKLSSTVTPSVNPCSMYQHNHRLCRIRNESFSSNSERVMQDHYLTFKVLNLLCIKRM